MTTLAKILNFKYTQLSKSTPTLLCAHSSPFHLLFFAGNGEAFKVRNCIPC